MCIIWDLETTRLGWRRGGGRGMDVELKNTAKCLGVTYGLLSYSCGLKVSTKSLIFPPVKLVHGLRTKPCPCVGRSWYGSGTSTWASSPTCATPSRRGGDSSCWSGRHREDPGHRVNNQGCTHSQALSASSKSWVETWERDYIVLYIASYPGLPSQLFSQPWK